MVRVELGDASNLMGNLMHAQYRAHYAIICVAHATTPDQKNIQLRFLGSNLAVKGQINAAVAYQAFVNPPARSLAYPLPTYMRVIFSVLQGFTFISGITAMAIGWLLCVMDNPRQHRRLAKIILLLMQLASVFAFRILLLACSSSG